MNIAIVGTGYVGLVSGACFAHRGIDVTCIDIDVNKINRLKAGDIPIYEPGLDSIVKDDIEAGRLHFSTDLKECIDNVDIVFSAVGTPPDEDGSADLKYVLSVAKTFGENIHKYTILVTKSTVPVGTAAKVKAAIQEALDKRGSKVEFDVVSNPEFLKEGDAVNDFLHPDRVVIGTDSQRSLDLMTSLYNSFHFTQQQMIFTDIASAEMIKYAANSMLATRISFMNDIANLCSIIGADVEMVKRGIGADTRIGKKFLNPGCGYGGSCFPKDVKALIKTATNNGYQMEVLQAVESVNKRQKEILFNITSNHFHGELKGKTIGLWGLSFKPETDDMREAPALVLIDKFVKCGCNVKVFDPIAMDECKRRIGNIVSYCTDKYEVVNDADALLLVTEWREFAKPDLNLLQKCMRHRLIVDGRNLYDRKEMEKAGFEYYSIGR